MSRGEARPRIEVVPAIAGHIAPIAAHMRQADRDEVWASSLNEPETALSASLAASPLAWTGLVDGIPVCMFGAAAAAMLASRGCPWLLGTAAVEDHAVAFLRRNRAQVRLMLEVFGTLANHVDSRNTVSRRWLEWLGFTIHPAKPYGPLGLPFHPFCLGRPLVTTN